MQLFLKTDRERWPKGDFTDDNANAFTGTIYTKATFQTADVFDITGYTLTIKLYNQRSEEIYSDDDTANIQIVVGTDGTWRYKPNDGDWNFDFIGEVKIELEQSGERLTAEGRNGSAILRIRD